VPPLHHQLERSLSRMTLGVVRRVREVEAASSHLKLTEREEQFQIPIQGTAYQGIVWIKKPITFETRFFGATGQRDSELERPQVSYGYVIDPTDPSEPTAPLVVSLACEFRSDDREATYAAVVHIGVHSPTPDPVDFEGYVHLTFQGWGAPIEDESTGD
jgi:hypothetical protein